MSTYQCIHIQQPTVGDVAPQAVHQTNRIYQAQLTILDKCTVTTQDNTAHQFAITLSYLYMIRCSKCSAVKVIITASHNKLSCRRGTAWHAMSAEVSSTVANLYEKSRLKMLAICERPWRSSELLLFVRPYITVRGLLSNARTNFQVVEDSCAWTMAYSCRVEHVVVTTSLSGIISR